MSSTGTDQPSWPLAAVVEYLGVASEILDRTGDLVVSGICHDSRLVQPGDIYAALPGARHHGGEFVAEAVARGAVAVMSDRPTEIAPTLVVDNPRKALGPLASWIHGRPSSMLDVYGVTGTNGKTSTAFMLEAGLRAAGKRTGLVSGVCVRGPEGSRQARRTTPEAGELQTTLAGFVRDGVEGVAMEVSSHGLAQHRIDGTYFHVAAFTNLARDHLDFHRTMAEYFEAKAMLFTDELCAAAVVGVDDPYGRALAARIRVPTLSVSSRGRPADVVATAIQTDRNGTDFTLHHEQWVRRIRLRMLGSYQVDNALTAFASLRLGGVDMAAAIDGIEELNAVPGRLERVDLGQDYLAFVDYVHNPAAQRRLFPYLRTLTSNRLIVVLGATGGRDPGKRKPLGRIAGSFADIVIVTDEGPFDDDAARLRDDVAAGAREAQHATVLVVPDRGEALAIAVAQAQKGDTVIVAGRGHDHVMNYDGVEVPFHDRRALEQAMIERA